MLTKVVVPLLTKQGGLWVSSLPFRYFPCFQVHSRSREYVPSFTENLAFRTRPAIGIVEDLTKFDPVDSKGKGSCSAGSEDIDSPPTVVEQVAEREALVELIGSLNTALLRKDLLLNALEKLDDLVSSRLPPEALRRDSVSLQLQNHRSWLDNSIRETDYAIDKQLDYLFTFYGEAYLPEEYVTSICC